MRAAANEVESGANGDLATDGGVRGEDRRGFAAIEPTDKLVAPYSISRLPAVAIGRRAQSRAAARPKGRPGAVRA
jgi:hypothetical protein